MSTATIDETLARLRAASDRISTNLLDFECDPDRVLLEAADLEGVSGERWDEASAALAELFDRYAQLVSVLDEATALRGARAKLTPDRERELAELLEGPSIELSTTPIPLGERELLGDHATVTRCTPNEVLSTMAADFERAKTVVADITEAWNVLVERLSRARDELSTATQLATDLGSSHDVELARIDHRMTVLGEAVLSDPLSVDRGEVEAIVRRIAEIGDELKGAEDLRDSVERRLGNARALLGEVQSAVGAAQQAHQAVLEKIASPAVPEGRTVEPATLAADLEAVEDHARRGDWTAANRELETWTDRARKDLRTTEDEARALRAPIDERNELRGRLEAYRAKASAVGLLEDSQAAALYVEARTALYTAPTDLAAADELVNRYRLVLAGARSKEVPEDV